MPEKKSILMIPVAGHAELGRNQAYLDSKAGLNGRPEYVKKACDASLFITAAMAAASLTI